MNANPYYNKVNYEMFIAGYLQSRGMDIKNKQKNYQLNEVEKEAHKKAALWITNQLRLECI